jgi:hypothetical protein
LLVFFAILAIVILLVVLPWIVCPHVYICTIDPTPLLNKSLLYNAPSLEDGFLYK